MSIKWLTQKEIKERAKKSKREAIKVSWEHWEQLATATRMELTKKADYVSTISQDYCGLCQRYNPRHWTKTLCRTCPLFNPQIDCCKEYSIARTAYCNWRGKHCKHPNFQKAARVLANKLKRLLKKEK